LPIIRKLPQGKIPIEVLGPILDSFSSKDLVVAPGIGVDVGVTESRGRYLVCSSDPITGAGERIGWHAVNVSANDVATSGIMPDALSVVSLFPSKTPISEIKALMKEIDSTARDLGIAVAGGHTEITPGLKRSVIVVTCFGSGDRFVTAADAKAGDSILMTKAAGIEGTAILSRLSKTRALVGGKTAREGSMLIGKLSVLKEARTAFSTWKVHAMHDVTEGGVLGAVFEMSLASHLGFEVEKDLVPVEESTRRISEALSIDPLKLIGSGSLLISCSKEDEDEVRTAVEKEGIKCTKIGSFVSSERRRVLSVRGKFQAVKSSIEDELWRVLSKYGNLS
jgi:hydrogenase expression/formation protein HypE